MVNVQKESDCCGCGACMQACPRKCITMELGTLGALFPTVKKDLCINCGLCNKVCPMQTPRPQSSFSPSAYAAFSKNPEIRNSGSSGGMFETFSRCLMGDGYVVYGAAFDENLNLKHVCATSPEELPPLLKSKYLQSDLSEKYDEIKQKLTEGQKILFVSTPCQVFALQNYLGKKYENLITVDFICHGVPSQTFFDQCRALEEKRLGGRITEYQFRSKIKKGATPHYYTLQLRKNGRVKSITDFYFNSPFYALFQQYITLRESCYTCPFASKERSSDITIGDFHDIDSYVSGINRFDGVSTVIINTEKGQGLWRAVKEDLVVHEISYERLIEDKVIFSTATPRPPKRDAFVHDYSTMPLETLVQKYAAKSRYRKQRIYYHLPRFVRDKLKRTLLK